ncbi:hypothetical protein RclHR1_00740030 [Rhizophagus clarus]|nr:hypothetical protein RclHR1_00740030 [Rhizophagus clarus]
MEVDQSSDDSGLKEFQSRLDKSEKNIEESNKLLNSIANQFNNIMAFFQNQPNTKDEAGINGNDEEELIIYLSSKFMNSAISAFRLRRN